MWCTYLASIHSFQGYEPCKCKYAAFGIRNDMGEL